MTAVAFEAGPMVPLAYRVAATSRDTHDTSTLELDPLAFAIEPEPGQFAMLYAFGVGEVPISLSGLDGNRLIHTIREVGAVTHALCGLGPGDDLGVRGPFGNTWPLVEGADHVVVAGGLGLAPLRPAIRALAAEPERYGRVSVLYGARTPDDLLYPREWQIWHERGLDVRVTVDAAPSGWDGTVGVVTTLVERAAFDPATAVALVCGPEIMMRFAAQALAARGVGSERTYVSLERAMKCGIGHCGHCQLGPTLVCRDGPVYAWSEVEPWLEVREL
jgi:NAD(P)H-flavin reductase